MRFFHKVNFYNTLRYPNSGIPLYLGVPKVIQTWDIHNELRDLTQQETNGMLGVNCFLCAEKLTDLEGRDALLGAVKSEHIYLRSQLLGFQFFCL